MQHICAIQKLETIYRIISQPLIENFKVYYRLPFNGKDEGSDAPDVVGDACEGGGGEGLTLSILWYLASVPSVKRMVMLH